MNFTFATEPSLLHETAILLFRHAMGITQYDMERRLIRRNARNLSEESIAQLMPLFESLNDVEQVVCEGIDENESFKYYFCDCGMECSGEDSLAVRCLATSVLLAFDDPLISDYDEQISYLKRTWKKLKETGYEFEIEKMYFEIAERPGVIMDDNYLFNQIDKLPFSREFLYKLYKAYSHYDETVDELAAFLRPYAMKLKHELNSLMPYYDNAMEHWKKAIKCKTSGTLANSLPYMGLSLDSDLDATVNVSLIETCFFSMVMLPAKGKPTLSLYMGADVRNESPFGDPAYPIEYVYGVMKILADPAKLKILHHLSVSDGYCAELAVALGLDSGNTSRYLRMLADMGFITSYKQGSKVFYKTNDESIRRIMQSVTSFITRDK